MRYATIFGFGLFDQSNPKYKAYVDRFALFVKKNKIDEVVICGGHTNAAVPEKSEAGTIAEYLRPILGNVKMHVEDRSLTSEQNIAFAKQFIDINSAEKIFVIVDSVRFFKVFWMILDRWFGLGKRQIEEEWLNRLIGVYTNPKKKDTTLAFKDIKKLLFYKNVKLVVDRHHKEYRSAMHTIISEPFEIEALYDQAVYDKFLEMTKKKFKM